MSSASARRERLSALALEHVRCEDAGDLEGTLATFEEGASFQLLPCGLELRTPERIRRYYQHFFAHSRKRCVAYRTHGTQEGDEGFGIEMTVTMRYDDGAERDFRVITIFRYGETALLGERIYADPEFFRLVFGPLFGECEPMDLRTSP